jgi:hypothetical protein
LAFGYYTRFLFDIFKEVILNLMNNSRSTFAKKGFIALVALAIISMIPSSFAEELIKTITGDSPETVQVEQVPSADEPVAKEPDPESTPSPEPSDLGKSEAEPSPSPSGTAEASPTPSPTPTPTPTPPFAIANQSMMIIAPSEVKIDPRARSVFLPKMHVANGGNLLICASSTLGSFDANIPNISSGEKESSLEISGAYTPYLRISGIGSQAAGIINSGNGLRVFSPSNGLAGSYIQLRFVALSKVSNNPKLCSDGSPSNTRTIYLRALGLDLNITKGGITLKQ